MLFLTLGADMTRPSRTGGKTSEAKARSAGPAKHRKTTKTKRSIAPAATRVKRRSVPGPSKELKEAREQQAATAEILKVIASSPDDVQPVLEAVAERAMSLLDAWSVLVTRFDGELLRFGAARGALPDTEQFLRNYYPMVPEAAVFAGRCILERTAINISDAQVDPSAAAARVTHEGREFFFCTPTCRNKFVADPTKYSRPANGGPTLTPATRTPAGTEYTVALIFLAGPNCDNDSSRLRGSSFNSTGVPRVEILKANLVVSFGLRLLTPT